MARAPGASASEQEKGAIFQQAVEFSEGLRKSGVYQASDPLQPTRTATTVRMKNGKTITTDGPFAETKEQLGGAPASWRPRTSTRRSPSPRATRCCGRATRSR